MSTWFITGTTSGIGHETVVAALAAGHNVVAASRRPVAVDELVSAYPERYRTVALDVTDAGSSAAAIAYAVEEFGGLDVIVNNAGYANTASIEEGSEEDFRAQIDVNFYGVYNVTRAALPLLRRQRSGVIVQISSIGGRVAGSAGIAAYQAAKGAVEAFSDVLRTETEPFGVKVIIVEPGGFRTGWGSGATGSIVEPGPDYDASVGDRLRAFATYVGNEPGDPARAAAAILDAAEASTPPRRLILGSDALERARTNFAFEIAEADDWEKVSRSTDFAA
ncbi:SDR family NAD(P)-dependent oxidoreductase [Glaciihabitans sp. dw_435]|uniref:SDR family NAD(P)-dependent oxidoreductase n=1 Tax=Glaciihabitans sp. dw_435 TaxID=2720081 RepID=UPI001BD6A91C|nr:SDR family NAD(P)-dependent oxidoreductase [Glaciihabitans sp. dw_435]